MRNACKNMEICMCMCRIKDISESINHGRIHLSNKAKRNLFSPQMTEAARKKKTLPSLETTHRGSVSQCRFLPAYSAASPATHGSDHMLLLLTDCVLIAAEQADTSWSAGPPTGRRAASGFVRLLIDTESVFPPAATGAAQRLPGCDPYQRRWRRCPGG